MPDRSAVHLLMLVGKPGKAIVSADTKRFQGPASTVGGVLRAFIRIEADARIEHSRTTQQTRWATRALKPNIGAACFRKTAVDASRNHDKVRQFLVVQASMHTGQCGCDRFESSSEASGPSHPEEEGGTLDVKTRSFRGRYGTCCHVLSIM